MTSLYPGLLFYSSGLNKNSTPTKPEATPSEIDHQLGRVAFNGRPWPKSSPVSSVYDVRNSSTRMIILNNKLSRRPKGSRLRGQTDHQGEITTPQPNRHVQEEPKTNHHHHKNCNTYNSEKFVPVFPPSTPSPAWVNNSQRPPMKFDNGSLVNPNHHIHCQGHMDYDIMRWYNAQRSRPRSRVSTKEEERSLSPILSAPGLKSGEKRYLSSIARIYSVSDMKTQTSDRYKHLMAKEISKGTYKYTDWDKYQRYLNTPRKTQFGPCDTFREKSSRSASAPGTRKLSPDLEERPHTTQVPAKPTNSSTRPAARTPKGRDRKSGKTDKSADLAGKPARPESPLTGKPARVESPLPLKPRESESPSPVSSPDLSDTNESPKQTEQDNSPVVNTEDAQTEPPKAETPEDTTQRSEVEPVDEDERSKMPARDVTEQRGDHVEYHPTHGGLKDERSQETSTNKDVSSSDKETYQPASSEVKETEKQDKDIAEAPKFESQKQESPAASAEDVKSAASLASLDEKKNEVSVESRDVIERPSSQAGGRDQFNVAQKDHNSDDDYSDDDDVASPKTKAVDEKAGGVEKDQTTADVTDKPEGERVSQDVGSVQKAETTAVTTTAETTPTAAKPTEDTPTKDTLTEDTHTKDTPTKDTLTEDTPTEAPSIEATPTEDSLEKPSDISTIEY